MACTSVNRGTSQHPETEQTNNGYHNLQNEVLNERKQSPVIPGIANRQSCRALPQVIVDIILS